ncbi:hypothetical protein M011DRAFT_464512 [Sporormia fimetaria CBS 119925]|uniref:Uncharacterized protein n=1 Tax=Sporormia fimetaria CBS 119925 TaxID=1340428 RepID=A0A6A6VJB1_9PLEO|nr:hypothetical protein M011DRAFT_464512 [Sporormia fimetaria CBS 119925]
MATSADWLTSFAAEGFKSSGPGVERRLETPAIGEAPSDTAREGEQAAKEEHLDTPNLDTPNFHTPDKQPDTPQTGPVDPGPEPTHLTNATVDQVPDSQPVGDTAPEKTGSPASHHEFHDVADADNREDKERGKEAPASPGPDGTVTEESAAIESTPEGSNAIERQDMERVKTEKVTSQEPPSDTETTAANPTLSPNRGEDQEAKLSPGPPTAAVSRVAEENHSETPASPPSTPTPGARV